jgi:hypothetical protein
VVELRRADGPAGVRVEEDDVRIAPGLDRALPAQPEQPGGRRRQDVDHPLRAHPALDDPLVDGREQGLDARRAVREPVERDALGRLALLDREAIGHVVRRHHVERALDDARPHRGPVVGGAERWRDARLRDLERVGGVVALLGQSQVVRTRLGMGPDARRLRFRDVPERLRARQVDDVDGCLGGSGERHRTMRRDRLGLARSRRSVVTRCRVATLKRRLDGGIDQHRVLAMELEHPAALSEDAHRVEDRAITEAGSRRP